MSTTYNYQRNKISGGYDLENVIEEIGDTVVIHPSCDINSAFPTRNFLLFGADVVFSCVLDEELSPEEKNVLDAIIEANRIKP